MQESTELSARSVTITAHPAAENNLFEQESAWHSKIAERAFAYFQDRGSVDGYDWADWVAAESKLLKPVALEIRESEDGYIVSAEVPGFSAKDLEIQMDGTRMLIHGVKTAGQSADSAAEQAARPIHRLIEFSFPVVAEGCRAQAEDGILEVTLPKSKEQSDPPAASE
jgi:HSP20 family molecular chaperone IbpA